MKRSASKLSVTRDTSLRRLSGRLLTLATGGNADGTPMPAATRRDHQLEDGTPMPA
jgi:hypothetical protein